MERKQPNIDPQADRSNPPFVSSNEAVKSVPYLRMRAQRMGAIMLTGPVISILMLASDHLASRSAPNTPGQSLFPFARFAFAPPVIVSIVVGMLAWSWNRRVRRLVKAADGRLCPFCAHDQGTDPRENGGMITCPECGKAFHPDHTRSLWLIWARVRP